MKSILGRAVGSLLDLVFPSTRVHCGANGSLFCVRCIASTQALDPNVCQRCADSMPASDRILTAYQMDGPIRSAVHALKYDGLTAIAPVLGSLLMRLDALHRVRADVVVPVPLHPRRHRERGFNQAELLALPIATELGLPMRTTAIRRVRHTSPQVAAGEKERIASMRGAFEATDRLDGEHVLLVDDVVTTTGTGNSAAAALKSAGAGRVTVLALARELQPPQIQIRGGPLSSLHPAGEG